MKAQMTKAHRIGPDGQLRPNPKWKAVLVTCNDPECPLVIVEDDNDGKKSVRILATEEDEIGPYTWLAKDMREIDVPDELIREALDTVNPNASGFSKKWNAFLRSKNG